MRTTIWELQLGQLKAIEPSIREDFNWDIYIITT